MIYIKRVTSADITRQIDLNKESSLNFFNFNFETQEKRDLIFVDEDSEQTSTGTIKKSGHTITITGQIFSNVKSSCEQNDLLLFKSNDRTPDRYYYRIIKLSNSKYNQFNSALELLGSRHSGLKTTTHLVMELQCEKDKNSPLSRPLQQISYGAPGTGKSFGINEDIKNQGLDAVRTTFHPDSDYSTFVGAYKPAMGKAKVYGAQGPLQHQGNDVEEDKITYKFVPQAFTKAYVKAWQKMAEPNDEGKAKPQILVIEEINRGNCAQIFGDLFQLLDRDDDGYSSYPIQADEDLRQHIAQELATCEGLSEKFENIKNGTELMLPPNLYIWATMNTSDQSLFPIDSAFKRRWEWKYMKISNAHKNWKITAGDKQYDWWNFIEKINNEIAAATSSDDKKLGYFFCKPNEGDAINAERFVGKVIFYLWNDVFKDEAPVFFNVIENAEPSFDAFFEQNGEVNTAAVQKFMEALGVEVKIMPETQKEQSE